MNILFRCDASVEIGMGHMVRCLALADNLKEHHNCNIHFAMRRSELGINKVKETYPVLQANESDFSYKEWLTDCIERTNAIILILDMRDGLTREELKFVKKKTGIKVVTIDDPEDKRLAVDLAFYPPIPQLEKFNWDGFNGKLYVGWEYVLLRKEFLEKYQNPNNSIPHILVTMGGTDEKNMTEFVVNSLNQIERKFKAIIIVGSGYPHNEKLKKSLEKVHFEFELYQNPQNIAEIMSQAELAIISFGQTAYELAALNVPAFYFCLTKDHENSARLFIEKRIGKSLGIFPLNKKHLIKKMKKYLFEKGFIIEMSRLAQLLNISNLNLISKLIIKEQVNA